MGLLLWRRAEFVDARSQSETTRWAWSGSKAGLTNGSSFEELEEDLRPDQDGEARSQSVRREEPQASAASDPARALSVNLMEEVTNRDNLNRAFRHVRANKGAAGVDGMTVGELRPGSPSTRTNSSLRCWTERINRSRCAGWKSPSPEAGCDNWASRPWWIGSCSKRSCRCWRQSWTRRSRPRASAFARDAAPMTRWRRPAATWPRDGTIVVDLDLEKFFDRVNHDILMSRLARRIGDKRLLRIIRRFLEAGMLQNGVCVERHEGTPQGGPLSPLLANLLLDDLDQGTRTAWAQVLSLRRRLQHLRAVAGGGGTGAGVGDEVSSKSNCNCV